MKPSEIPITIENIAQDQQFNRRRGAKQKSFKHGDEVFVKVYKNNKFKWTRATIIEPIGNAMYVAEIGPKYLVRAHKNQLRLAYTLD